MLSKFERKFLRLTELIRTEGTVAVARRLSGKLRNEPVSAILCNLDLPVANNRNDLHLEVYGWAVSKEGSIKLVEVFLDGKRLGEAEYGLDRPDVAAALPEFNLIKCGFAGLFLLEASSTTDERVLLLRTHDSAGNRVELKRNILVQSKAELEIKVPALDFQTPEVETLSLLNGSAVSAVIPTLNPGDELAVLLSALKSQEGIESVELIVVDSGSNDQTVKLSREYGAKVIEIAPEDFSHSKSRNLGAEHANGHYLLFMTQDALPGSRHWLHEMISAARKYESVAVSCAETPRADVDLFSLVNSWHHNHFLGLHEGDRISSYPPPSDYEGFRKHCQLNNVACLIERAVFEKHKFCNDYAEDLDLGMRLANAGHNLALLSSTRVIHSHNRNAYYHLRRAYVDTYYLAQSFSDLPLMQYLELDVLREEIGKTYRQLGLFVETLSSQIKLPCNTGMLIYAMEKSWDSIHGNILRSEQIFEACVEESYRSFINRITKPISAIHNPASEEGTIMHSVNGAISRTSDYLQMIFENIDERIFTEFRQSIFKAHALATGMSLASYYLQTSEPGNEMADKLQLELKQGV